MSVKKHKIKSSKKLVPSSLRRIPKAVIWVGLFAIVGVAVLLFAKASSPFVSIEAETSALSGSIALVSDTSASNGGAVQFHAAAPDSGTTTCTGSTAQFCEDFTGNKGLNRFRWGVYHRAVGYREMDQTEPFNGIDNNALSNATWTGDHDLNCGGPDTQRPLSTETIQDTTGANGWQPIANFHVKEVVYACKDHFMTSMGPASGFDVIWIAPEVSFPKVKSFSFKVNLTDLGPRKWWKMGVVSDTLYNSFYYAGWNANNRVRGVVVSDVGASDLDGDLEGPDRLIATWAGGASAGRDGCIKIGNPQTGICTGQNQDKATRYPVSFVDNGNGTTTFTVNGTSTTRNLPFPPCPCHVVIYDQNYTPDKDGVPIGHTWHWDDIIVN